ncbi:MAG: ArgE/DapE family deacylase [Gemmatimonadota bacterium]
MDVRIDTAALLSTLVAVPSVNPLLAPGASGAGEAAIAQTIRDWLGSRGIRAALEEVEPGRSNVVARVGSGAAPVLVLCAHIDTVPGSNMDQPFDPRVEAGRLYGRGSYDMKGGVAAVMCALADLSEQPPGGTVVGAFVVDEEYASAGAFDFVKRHAADACILTEPSEEHLVLAHKGFIWLEIETTGFAAHGSRWDLGRSAIADMARIATALDNYDRTTLRARQHRLTGPASLHCGTIAGGDGWSTYAAHCTLQVERRTIPGESADEVVEEVRRIVAGAGAEARIEVVLVRDPLECEPSSPIAMAVRDAARSVLGRQPEDRGVAYWMDAAVFANAGIPTVNYGPAGAGAHAVEEWVDLASVERTAAVLAGAARAFCGP